MSRPQSPDVPAFRRAMGLFATGVTVVATTTPQGEPICMIANAVASLSLDPMLLLVCVDKRANMASHILQAPGFSICILSAEQEALSDYFAGRWRGEPPPFVLKEWIGGPLLGGCIAGIGCEKVQVYEGGDHWIVIGQVTALHSQDSLPDPLIFYGRRYRYLASA
ncbi:MAG: flavin reductase family protein [Anaerolineae bacterium]|nr:flavin reductase family protein [Anaerolineae bacterium]